MTDSEQQSQEVAEDVKDITLDAHVGVEDKVADSLVLPAVNTDLLKDAAKADEEQQSQEGAEDVEDITLGDHVGVEDKGADSLVLPAVDTDLEAKDISDEVIYSI